MPPMSRSLRFVSTESSMLRLLPVEVGAAHVAGLVLARAAVVGMRPVGSVLVGLQYRLQVPVPGDGRPDASAISHARSSLGLV